MARSEVRERVEGLIGQVGGSGTASPKSEVGACGEPQSSWRGVNLLATLPLGLHNFTALVSSVKGTLPRSLWLSITLFSLLVLCPSALFLSLVSASAWLLLHFAAVFLEGLLCFTDL